MSGWARPGVKCVFVGIPAGQPCDWRGISRLSEGAIYTIRDILDPGYAHGPVIRLEEVINPRIRTSDWGMAERAYPLVCFRPLISKTQEQDVELFLHLLDGLPVGEPV